MRQRLSYKGALGRQNDLAKIRRKKRIGPGLVVDSVETRDE